MLGEGGGQLVGQVLVSHHHGGVGVVQDVGQLGRPQVPVDREERGVEYRRGHRHLEDLHPVGQDGGHRMPGAGAEAAEDRGQPPGPVVQLAVGAGPRPPTTTAGRPGSDRA